MVQCPVNRREFERTVDRVIEELPEWVTERIENLVVVVEDYPTKEQDPAREGILGIYEGISLLERGADYWGALPDRITIFRQPHLALVLPPKELTEEIRRTVLHELAHHLGIEDDRLEALGWE